MIKYVYIITILTPMVILKAQNDSLSKKLNWLSHFAGIDVGYSEYGDKTISGYKAETNLNYVFNPHYFIAKAQLGVAPATNFGTLKKGFIGIGFSTKTNKMFSWHLITGVGMVSATKEFSVIEKDNFNYVRTYSFFCSTQFIETGIYSKPIRKIPLIVGINLQLYKSTIAPNDLSALYYVGYYQTTPNINFSINYKLNR